MSPDHRPGRKLSLPPVPAGLAPVGAASWPCLLLPTFPGQAEVTPPPGDWLGHQTRRPETYCSAQGRRLPTGSLWPRLGCGLTQKGLARGSCFPVRGGGIQGKQVQGKQGSGWGPGEAEAALPAWGSSAPPSLPPGVRGLLCKGVVGKAKERGRQSTPPAPRAVRTQGDPLEGLLLRQSATFLPFNYTYSCLLNVSLPHQRARMAHAWNPQGLVCEQVSGCCLLTR